MTQILHFFYLEKSCKLHGSNISSNVNATNHIISYYVMLCHIISYHVISYYVTLYHATLHHIISYHIILFYVTIFYQIILYHVIFISGSAIACYLLLSYSAYYSFFENFIFFLSSTFKIIMSEQEKFLHFFV